MQTVSIQDETSVCTTCGAALQSEENFCGQCGASRQHEDVTEEHARAHGIAPTILYYFPTLALLATYKFTKTFPEGYDGLLLVSLLDIGIVIAFSLYFLRDLLPLYTFKSFTWKVLSVVIIASIGAAFVVDYVAHFVNVAIYDETFFTSNYFMGTENPLFWSILVICVQPAIFEELAFRGFLFTNIDRFTNASTALYVSSFLFGVTHLSFVSLFWLVPLGLAAAWLRMKYSTLWYGMIAHFVYNFSIVLIDFYLV